MQTIKTAAIVVLMLTVLYGGYVSLTTPPEPLPAEVEEYLVIEESNGGSFDAPSGLDLSEPPPLLADVASETVSAPGMASQQVTQPAGGPSFGGSFADISPNETAGTPASTASFGMPSDPMTLPAGPSLPSDALAMPTAQDLPTGSASPLPLPSSVPSALPPIESTAGTLPNTGQEFTMPDPAVAAANFVPSSQPFVGSPLPNDATSVSATLSDRNVPASAEVPQLPSAVAPTNQLTNAFATADAMYGKGQLKEALATLSVFYGTPNLSPLEREQLLSRLDPLARDVIYSKRHLLEQPHRVTTNETLPRIAERYNVPWELLANINHVDDPVTVLPGTELKVVRGPFRAEVNLTTKELTLFLGDLYAGRFEVGIGNDPPPAPGTFSVQDKQPSHVYYNREGVPVPADSPDNPYGKAWFDLGGSLCIHGSPNTVRPSNVGCISLAGDHARDLYGILTQGSVVSIRR